MARAPELRAQHATLRARQLRFAEREPTRFRERAQLHIGSSRRRARLARDHTCARACGASMRVELRARRSLEKLQLALAANESEPAFADFAVVHVTRRRKRALTQRTPMRHVGSDGHRDRRLLAAKMRVAPTPPSRRFRARSSSTRLFHAAHPSRGIRRIPDVDENGQRPRLPPRSRDRTAKNDQRDACRGNATSNAPGGPTGEVVPCGGVLLSPPACPLTCRVTMRRCSDAVRNDVFSQSCASTGPDRAPALARRPNP